MLNPKISIVLPVYNGESVLSKTLAALKAQTFSDFEAIFVDDGSTDGSAALLKAASQTDPRIRLLQQSHSGAGTARNLGLDAARGAYVIFSDCDDLYLPNALELMHRTACSSGADITACNYSGLDGREKEYRQTGIYTNFLPAKTTVFSYRDCPNDILRITSSVVWNKLYRREFLLEHGLRFDPLFTCNDLSFVAVSLAAAETVTFVSDHLIRYHFPRLNNPKNVADVFAAVESAFRQIQSLPHYEAIRNALLRFGIDHLVGGLKKQVKDFSDPAAAEFYRKAHDFFRQPEYDLLDPLSLRNGDLHREFLTVQKHDYETMVLLQSRKLIVSCTSYPRRIGTVVKALESIYAQTRPADEVVLWLAREQFPNLEADLPENLMALVREGKLTIGWCDDIKGHKKYFYALQKYSEDIVVTMDDDLLYPKDMLATLHKSYLLFPNAISTMRTHLILLSEENEILPYRAWLRETDSCMHKPSMQLMASGGAGDLYPPHLLRPEAFNHEAVMGCCLWADNLWIKFMELISDVPVVLAYRREPLQYVEDTQEETLFQINGTQNQYDIQMKEVIQWLEGRFEPGILQKKLTDPTLGVTFTRMEDVTRHINFEREGSSRKIRLLQNQLKQAQQENAQAAADAEQARALAARLQKDLEKSRTDALTQLGRMEEGSSVLGQLKALGSSAKGLKKLLYYLAWIPGGLLWLMMSLLKYGGKETIRRLRRK